jgi:hypothetical protein
MRDMKQSQMEKQKWTEDEKRILVRLYERLERYGRKISRIDVALL